MRLIMPYFPIQRSRRQMWKEIESTVKSEHTFSGECHGALRGRPGPRRRTALTDNVLNVTNVILKLKHSGTSLIYFFRRT